MKREPLYILAILAMALMLVLLNGHVNSLENHISLLEISRVDAKIYISELQKAHTEDSKKIKELEKRADDTDSYDLLELNTLNSILDYIQKQEEPYNFGSRHPQTISL